MLPRSRVANVRPLRDEQELSFVAPGQLWLTEKDERGATELSSISEWEPTDEEDLMASYLAGSFGAVPKVSEGQIGRRLLRTDELARTEADDV
ncbi:hypothetical protein OG709_16885 [Streptomyces sp. NBC_01267]|uniref:hypothetical protein n=1 Tax=Streptomyces sp. NBC_01267 TaxID=2903805 RepID=UPI002E37ED25|nr:hypothetical protein [Streptomyces sp. NBC_01267]